MEIFNLVTVAKTKINWLLRETLIVNMLEEKKRKKGESEWVKSERRMRFRWCSRRWKKLMNSKMKEQEKRITDSLHHLQAGNRMNCLRREQSFKSLLSYSVCVLYAFPESFSFCILFFLWSSYFISLNHETGKTVTVEDTKQQSWKKYLKQPQSSRRKQEKFCWKQFSSFLPSLSFSPGDQHSCLTPHSSSSLFLSSSMICRVK